jgi:hypothetical protein
VLSLHCKKSQKVSDFPVSSRDVTNQTLKLFPARESLVSDIPAGDGKIANSFLQCVVDPGSESGPFMKLIGVVSFDK